MHNPRHGPMMASGGTVGQDARWTAADAMPSQRLKVVKSEG